MAQQPNVPYLLVVEIPRTVGLIQPGVEFAHCE